ncbi:MAG TPA: hypothetical protein VMV20_04985, partial [Chitinophagaceae bacterium]|nr:hypothetical protein [Chitinophagaceae bacterium]
AVACLTLFTLSSSAQTTPKPTVMKGEVLDMACYMASGMHGASHKDCAQKCINGGSPMGLLTSSGKVYLLVENHDKPEAYTTAKTHAGDQIEVTGTYADKGGIQGLVVDQVK